MKRILLFLISALLLCSLVSCQTDFRRPPVYAFDVKHGEGVYSLDLSGITQAGTSKTYLFEVTNSGTETEYTLVVRATGNLPLTCSISPETELSGITLSEESATGRLGKHDAHTYRVTVAWPLEDHNHLFEGGTASVTVEVIAKKS